MAKYAQYGDKKMELGELSLEKAKEIIARFFPELAEPKVETKKDGDDTIYVFSKQAGRKGSNAQFTPGPWKVLEHYEGRGITTAAGIWTSDNYIVAEICGGGSEHGFEGDIANAHLIAAAPDLLAACEALLKFNEELCQDVNVSTHYPSAEKARNALAKARGESR